jgi:hypothetical protein
VEPEKPKQQPDESTLKYLLEVRPHRRSGRDYLVVWKKSKPAWGENQLWEHLTAFPIVGSLAENLAAGGNLAAADARAEELDEIRVEIEPPSGD